jgi:hypothetical protein
MARATQRRIPLRLYHRTTDDAARSILAGGFRDAARDYMFGVIISGVWFADRPLDENSGTVLGGEALLTLEIPDAVLEPFEVYELDSPGPGYREWLIPARIANLYRRRLSLVQSESELPIA